MMMLKYQNLIKKFGERIVLNDISLEINEGEIVFVLGTSGTGKSVLLKNTVGLLRPEAGEIWVDGQEISQFSEEQLFAVRKKCGMVFQHPALFDSMTVFENVAFGLRKHFQYDEETIKNKVLQALQLVQLQNIEDKKPAQISYGMQKRVSLARTLAVEPKILLFDEPTTGLDPITTNAINKLILDLSRKLKTTSVVVSHDMNCALAIADRIIVLESGKIIGSGTPAEMKKSQVALIREFLAEVNP